MDKPKILDVVNSVVGALEPFEAPERKRIIKAALTVLGDDPADVEAPKTPTQNQAPIPPSGDQENIHANAQRWMQNNSITREELDQVFQIESGAAHVLHVALPGNNNKVNTYSTYLLVGIASLISIGDPTINDKAARAMCETLGCYDTNNHASYMKEIGNIVNGTKSTGYKLSAPGLREGATLIKKIVGAVKKPA